MPGLGEGRIQMAGGYTDQTNLANLLPEGLNKFTISVPVNGYSEADRAAEMMSDFENDFPDWTVEPVSAAQNRRLIRAKQWIRLATLFGRQVPRYKSPEMH